jgi:hypothetical protein
MLRGHGRKTAIAFCAPQQRAVLGCFQVPSWRVVRKALLVPRPRYEAVKGGHRVHPFSMSVLPQDSCQSCCVAETARCQEETSQIVGWDRGADGASNDADVSSIPLRFRTAGLPRYGSKAGLSDRAFPDPTSIKLAPSMLVTGSGLHPSFVLSAAAWVLRSKSEATCSVEHRHASDMRRSTPGALAPDRVVLSRSIIT